MKIAIILIERTLPGIRELMEAVRKQFRAKVTRGMVDLGCTRSFRKSKNQYDAEFLLKELAGTIIGADKILYIFREDMFVPDLNFVFGLASGDVAIVSITRLDPRFYGKIEDLPKAAAIFRQRLIKEAIHEIGHSFKIPHCKNKKCVMVFSNSIADVDFKSAEFCNKCSRELDKKLEEKVILE